MELSWPTFFLEIVNFLVLVWILKRFLYKPILQAIEQRKAPHRQKPGRCPGEGSRSRGASNSNFKNALPIGKMRKENSARRITEEIAARRAQMMAALENSLKQEREKRGSWKTAA